MIQTARKREITVVTNVTLDFIILPKRIFVWKVIGYANQSIIEASVYPAGMAMTLRQVNVF